MSRIILLLAVFFLVLAVGSSLSAQCFSLPQSLPPSQYGNILMSRMSSKSGKPWVNFSHWQHRRNYTCRVCHLELGFEMKVNATIITEEDNIRSEYCGACHNGKTAFAHVEGNCSKCHNGDISYSEEAFRSLSNLPMARYGNRIDWMKAITENQISPTQSILEKSFSPMPFKKTIEKKVTAASIAPVVFSHEAHNKWLDCANCHPHIFKMSSTDSHEYTMENIMERKYCGVCHIDVAFPLNDCNRCHPGADI